MALASMVQQYSFKDIKNNYSVIFWYYSTQFTPGSTSPDHVSKICPTLFHQRLAFSVY